MRADHSGRETSLLLEVLEQTFKGDVRGSLNEFEVKIRKYERSCREILSDRVKIAVVQKGLEDDDLRRHLLMHASRLATYPLVREEIRSIIMAHETMTGPVLMDIGAVHKGKGKGKGKGKKGKGKGKEKDPAMNPGAEVVSYYCHWKGHRKRDCRVCKCSGASTWLDAWSRCDTITSEHDRVGRLDTHSEP